MKTLSVTPRPYDRWKAETLSFLHVLLVWDVILVSSLNKLRWNWRYGSKCANTRHIEYLPIKRYLLEIEYHAQCYQQLFRYWYFVQWVLRKRNFWFKYRWLGTVGIFTYYENNLGQILNNIASHGSIKRNRCQPWREWPERILRQYWFARACKMPNRL